MANFEDFIKVTNEAQKNIDLMKQSVETINDKITAIDNNKYERVKTFWYEVSKMFKIYNIIGKPFNTPFVEHYGSKIYFKIYLDSNERLEIGVYRGKDRFIRWMPFRENYKKFMEQGCEDIVYEIKDIIVNHWETYEKEFEVIVKEFITKIMAERIDNEKDRYEQAVNELAEKQLK